MSNKINSDSHLKVIVTGNSPEPQLPVLCPAMSDLKEESNTLNSIVGGLPLLSHRQYNLVVLVSYATSL